MTSLMEEIHVKWLARKMLLQDIQWFTAAAGE